jgi:glyoxylase-like metal-dependent hydrolase (beta-lactamase superfamily II)
MDRNGSSVEDPLLLAPGLQRVTLRTRTVPPAKHTHCYVLGWDELVVVDPGSPFEDEQTRLADLLARRVAAGGRLREIWITHLHRDHVEGVKALQRVFDIPAAAHRLTAEALAPAIRFDRLIPDDALTTLHGREGECARWRMLHTPGHARGHLCFFEERGRVLLSGDHVLGEGTPVIAPPEGNMTDYLRSLERLMSLDAAVLFGGHGPGVNAVSDKLEAYRSRRLEREAAIAAALDTPRTATEIVPRVYRNVPDAVYPLAELNVRAHLERLVEFGRVRDDGGRFVRTGG